MLLRLEKQTTAVNAKNLLNKLEWMGFTGKLLGEQGNFSIAILHGLDCSVKVSSFEKLPFVCRIDVFHKPYKLVSKDIQKEKTLIPIKDFVIGGEEIHVMAGPCAVESKAQVEESAAIVAQNGAKILRGGAFKPRTSPYSFQGLGIEGLAYLKEAAEKYDLAAISEIMDPSHIAPALEYVDIFQVGARNMQNFSLLKELGKTGKPIFLKRGMSATYKDLLMSAEYILKQGNPHVILCERGIRTFETHLRNTLDVAAIPALKELTHLPVFIDPSHGTGVQSMVAPMALAGTAAGADGIMVEIHPQPDKALCDKEQALSPEMFQQLMEGVKKIASAVQRKM
ncbi:MAG: 3-deoxy-7-phosphoheptulonate synthase [Simkaniaceae bacterium]